MSRLTEPASDLDLSQESFCAHQSGQLRAQHLDRDAAAVFHVLRHVDRRHAPAAQLALDGVAVGEGSLHMVEWVEHRDC